MNEYKKFKTMTKEQKFEYLYGLYWQNIITGLLMFLLGLGLIAFAQTVKAEGNEPTYYQYTANECYTFIDGGNGSTTKGNSTMDGRGITFKKTETTYVIYFITNTPGQGGGIQNSTSTCKQPDRTLSKVNDELNYYAYSSGTISKNNKTTFYPPVVESKTATVQDAIYYTYGEGAVEKQEPTYDYYCSGCQTFYYNRETSRYGSFQATTGLRVVYFNDRATFVSNQTFTMYLATSSNENPSSCGTNATTAREYVYKGTTYYYLTFSKQEFEGKNNKTYIDETGSTYKAIDYTYGENAVAPEFNICDINYGNVEKMYPTELVRGVAEFAQSSKGMYYSTSEANKSIAIYNTRYDKQKDALYSYYLVFDQSKGQNTYTLTNNGFTLQFNNIAMTSYGTTAIYDKDLFSGYTNTNNLTETDNYLNTKNGNVYSKIYPDPSKAFVGATIFDNQYRGVYSPLDFGYTSLSFTAYDTGKENPYFPGENILYYTATNETDEYYDYFILLALNLGQSSNMKSIYNYKGGITNEDGTANTTKQFYYAMSFLGIDDVGVRTTLPGGDENYEVGVDKDLDTSLDFKDQAALGISETEQQDQKRSKAQGYVNFSIGLNENLQNESQDYEQLLSKGQSNYAAIGNRVNGVFNNQFTNSAVGVSNQVDYVYYNTPISYFIDASMLFTLFMGVFF